MLGFKRSLYKFRIRWKSYVIQSLLATLTIFAICSLFLFRNMVVTASLGASVFVVFAMPHEVSARTRSILGGQAIGVASGLVGHSIAAILSIHPIYLYALAVGLALFLMVVLDMEHPPAAGTALGVAVQGISWQVALGVAAATIFLALVHRIFRPYIRNLV